MREWNGGLALQGTERPQQREILPEIHALGCRSCPFQAEAQGFLRVRNWLTKSGQLLYSLKSHLFLLMVCAWGWQSMLGRMSGLCLMAFFFAFLIFTVVECVWCVGWSVHTEVVESAPLFHLHRVSVD